MATTEPSKQVQGSSGSRVWVTLLKVVLAATVIYFAGRQLAANWQEVRQYRWTLNLPVLFLSVVLHLVTFAMMSQVWCVLVRAFGFEVPLKYGFKIGYIANLGRYIPGKIWPVIGMVYLLRRLGISKEVALASWGIATVLGLPPAFLAGAITIWFYPSMLSDPLSGGSTIGPLIAIAAVFGASLLLVFLPDKTMSLFNRLVKLLRRPPVDFKLEKSVAAKVYVGYFFAWVCYGVAFYTLLHGIMDEPGVPPVAGIGSFVMAYLIGYLAVFSPGGLGAREWILASVLAPFVGSLAPGIAVAARVWNLIVEFIAFVIAWLIPMNSKQE